MSSFLEAIENITPEIYQSLKLAVEIGKWPDGRKLSQEQKELTLQALIAWESHNLPEEERIGYMGPQECSSKSEPVPNLLFKSSDTLH
ncbi:YeaC family protein [Pseudomonas sp. EA_35y_Pfl2_R5]|uniref:YeaC family protein n=1 Tax=Pseudomonas sp. EA_35y_Pfl2_R5 TaxID=3088690 RepID=UPI0030DB2FFA